MKEMKRTTGEVEQGNEAKKAFKEPKLTKHGDATKITGQFFGPFTPP